MKPGPQFGFSFPTFALRMQLWRGAELRCFYKCLRVNKAERMFSLLSLSTSTILNHPQPFKFIQFSVANPSWAHHTSLGSPVRFAAPISSCSCPSTSQATSGCRATSRNGTPWPPATAPSSARSVAGAPATGAQLMGGGMAKASGSREEGRADRSK